MGNHQIIFFTCAILFLFSISPKGEAWSIPKDYELLDESDSSSSSALTSSSSDSFESRQENVNDNAIEVENGKIKTRQLLFPRFPAQIDKKLEMNRREKLFQTRPTVDEIVHRTLAWSNSLGIRIPVVNENGELIRRPNVSTILNSLIITNFHVKKELNEEEGFDDFDYELEEEVEENGAEEENVESNEETVHKTSTHITFEKDGVTFQSTEKDKNDISTESSSGSTTLDPTSTIPSVDTNSLTIDNDNDRELSPDEHEDIINLGTKLFAFGEHTEEDVRGFYNEMLTFDEYGDEDEEEIQYDQAAMDWPVVVETLTPSTHPDIEQMFTESPINSVPTESAMSNDESYWNHENRKLIKEDSGLVSVIQVFYPDAKIEMQTIAVGAFLSVGFFGIVFMMLKLAKKHKKLLKSEGDGKILI